MADDAPLASLAKVAAAASPSPKAVKASPGDDAPLTSLTALASKKPADKAPPPRSSPPRTSPVKKLVSSASLGDDAPLTGLLGSNAGAAKAQPGPKAKAKGQKRPGEPSDDSSSSDSSSDSSDSSDEGPSKAKRAKKGPTKKPPLKKPLRKNSSVMSKLGEEGEEGGGSEDEEDTKAAQDRVKKTKGDRGPKERVVAELLCRWWFVLPDWPPQDDNYYAEKLKEKGLRKVAVEVWEWVPEQDDNGLRKVYELTQYRGLFRNSAGEGVDLRPQETCPCFDNLMKKDLLELQKMLVEAYQNQLKDLENSKYDERLLKREVLASLTKARQRLDALFAVSSSARKK